MNSLEEQIKKVQRELEHLRKEHQDFLYVISHDMGATLRTIAGFTQVIKEEQGDSFNDETKLCFDFIMQSVEKSKAILEGLLDFSRLTTRTEPFSTFECNDLLKEVQISLAPLIDSKKALIEIPNLPEITANRQQIELLFFHLLQNALIYQKENTQPHISLTVRETENKWAFCIKDNGIGIPDHMTETIFNPLKRAVGDKYPGVGMGLPIVRKILQQHHGDIRLTTGKKKGTSFYFNISMTSC